MRFLYLLPLTIYLILNIWSLGWTLITNPPASVSWEVGSQLYATAPGYNLIFNSDFKGQEIGLSVKCLSQKHEDPNLISSTK